MKRPRIRIQAISDVAAANSKLGALAWRGVDGPWPGESSWSVLHKICLRNFIPPREIVSLLTRGQSAAPEFRRNALGDLKKPFCVGVRRELAKAIGCDEKCLVAISVRSFAGPAFQLLDLEHFSAESLRYCPRCIGRGFHAVYFQFLFIEKCPIHNARLVERCKNCSSRIPYSCPQRALLGFSCPKCGFSLLNSPKIRSSASFVRFTRRLARAEEQISSRISRWSHAKLVIGRGGYEDSYRESLRYWISKHSHRLGQYLDSVFLEANNSKGSQLLSPGNVHVSGAKIKKQKLPTPIDCADFVRFKATYKSIARFIRHKLLETRIKPSAFYCHRIGNSYEFKMFREQSIQEDIPAGIFAYFGWRMMCEGRIRPWDVVEPTRTRYANGESTFHLIDRESLVDWGRLMDSRVVEMIDEKLFARSCLAKFWRVLAAQRSSKYPSGCQFTVLGGSGFRNTTGFVAEVYSRDQARFHCFGESN